MWAQIRLILKERSTWLDTVKGVSKALYQMIKEDNSCDLHLEALVKNFITKFKQSIKL